MRIRGILKTVVIVLIAIVGFLLLLFVFINLPISHRFVTKKINNIFASSSLPVHIGSVDRVFPWSVHAEGVLINGLEGDTIVYVTRVRSGLRPLALLKRRVILKSVYLEEAGIKFVRSVGEDQLNIARAFSSGKKAEPVVQKNNKAPWEISVTDAEIRKLSFRMSDSVAGIYVMQDIERIRLVTKKMSLTAKTIIAKSLAIEGATGTLTLNNDSSAEKSDSSSAWNFGLGELSAKNINFVFDNPSGKVRLDLLAGEIEIDARETDINKKIIDFDRIAVSGTSLVYGMDSRKKPTVKNEAAGPGSFDWQIRGDLMELQDLACRIVNYSDSSAFNQSNLNIIGLGLKLTNLEIDQKSVQADLKKMKFDLGNGFSLRDMDGNIDTHSGTTRIKLGIETGSSRMNLEASADGTPFDIIANPSGLKKASFNLSNTAISLTDIFCFKPDLQKVPGLMIMAAKPLIINADLALDGSVMAVPDFTVSQDSALRFSLNGKISDIFKPENAVCDLKFQINELDNSWVKNVLEEAKIPFKVPDYKTLTLDGAISDSLMSPDFMLKLASDLGKIDLEGSLDWNHDKFSLKTHFDNVMLGKIFNNEILGSLNGSGEIDGYGIRGKALNAKAAFIVDSIMFKDYKYKNSRVVCSIQPGIYDIKLNVNDPSLAVNMNASLKMKDKDMTGSLTGSFLADLNNLKLYKDSIIVEGKIATNIHRNKDEIQGEATLSGIKFTTPEKEATINRISLSLTSDTLATSIVSSSDFFTAEGRAEKSAGGLANFLNSYIKYLGSELNPAYADSLKHISDLPEITGRINMTYNKAIGMVIPDSSLNFKNLDVSVKSDTENRSITYLIQGRGLSYKSFQIQKLNASLMDSASILDLKVIIDTLSGPQAFNGISVKSHFDNWNSRTSLSILDKEGRMDYSFDISSALDSNNIILEFPSGQMTLNGVRWVLDQPRVLKLNLKSGTFTPTLKMHTGDSFISLIKSDHDELQDYKLDLGGVKVSSILRSELLPGKPEMTISGSATYSTSRMKGTRLTAGLKIGDVKWYDLDYKLISLNGLLATDTTGNFDFEVNTLLDTSEIKIKIKKPDKLSMNISTSFNKIAVSTAQPFVVKYLSDLRGNLSGELNIDIEDKTNNFTGDISIKNANVRINTLNSAFRLPDEKIKFTGKKMVFNNFRVLDSLNNELQVDGSVDFSRRDKVSADLDIISSNLQVMHRKADKDATFYGDIFIDSRLSIKGAVTSPVLKGKIILAKGTNIYLKQSEDLGISESSNIITFVSKKPIPGQAEKKSQAGNDIYNKSSVEAVVEIDPATGINIEISKKMFNIDLAIKGGGELNYNMLVNSQVNMTGKYEISEGDANLKMVGWPNKAFKLTKGGFIQWDGKLDDPDLKLEAVNRVKSSYVNPVDNKERYVDFDVALKISNRLSAMNVLFTISTSDQYLMSIINTMSPDEQMRQAITILLFQYIDLPGISTSSNYVSEQVNQMVAAQLNSLTKTTIKGIDISFGLDTYTQGTASGGQQTKTSLSYDVKKNLLNDRAKIEFSGIVSDASNQSKTTNTSLNNFTFEYRIDSAGTKFLKVYNEHSYEDVFEGDVVKTGVGFSYRKSYPYLRAIWGKEEKVRHSNNPDK